jgi:signal peptidase II
LKKTHFVFIIVLLVVLIDQWSKIWIKTNMSLYESYFIFGKEWAQIKFIENKGMAFGIELGGDMGKVLLSGFRLVAVVLLSYFITKLDQEKVSRSLYMCFALVLAGAIGNILDSLFYGLIFSESSVHGTVAQMFPSEGGYAGFMHGKVVDMFYFPIIRSYWPDWVPMMGGSPFEFFSPIFNVADSAISLGIAWMILFHSKFFQDPESYLKQVQVAKETA